MEIKFLWVTRAESSRVESIIGCIWWDAIAIMPYKIDSLEQFPISERCERHFGNYFKRNYSKMGFEKAFDEACHKLSFE